MCKPLTTLGLAILLVAATSGCVRRTIKITTEPPGARVFLNDQEVGRSEVSTDFLWYGDYDVVVRKEDPRGRAYYWIAGEHHTVSGEPDTDLAVVSDGWISVTPLRVDITDYEGLGPLEHLGESW